MSGGDLDRRGRRALMLELELTLRNLLALEQWRDRRAVGGPRPDAWRTFEREYFDWYLNRERLAARIWLARQKTRRGAQGSEACQLLRFPSRPRSGGTIL